MGLRLYLDDCAYDKLLRDLLRAPPNLHFVVTPIDSQTIGAMDSIHFAYAQRNDLILVTKNPSDFIELHLVHPDHPGLFVIFQDNLPSDMKATDIVRAIENVTNASIPIKGHVISLNDWKF